jgi:hypothetical protein
MMKTLSILGTALALAVVTSALAQDDDAAAARKARQASRKAAADARHANRPATAAPAQRPVATAPAVRPARITQPSTTVTQLQRRDRNREDVTATREGRVRPDRGTFAPTTNSETTVTRTQTAQRPTNAYRTFAEATRNYHRSHHDRRWYRSRFNTFVLFGGGYYYQDRGYWYPAWGYDPYYSNYTYDQPIYAYDGLPPGQVVASAQRELQRRGYYRSSVDGVMGPMTRAAIANFQRDAGLPITSAIDRQTLASLGLA